MQQKVSAASSFSSCLHPASVAIFDTGKEDIGSAFDSKNQGLSASGSSSASALTDTADSTTLCSSLPQECTREEQQLVCCASSDEEVESCCGGDDAASDVDIAGFLLHEGWDDAGCEGCDALAFNNEAILLNGGPSTDCSEEVAFAGCFAENGNWFLNELEGEGNGYLNEVLDQEWMAAAMANLDRINDTLDTDICMLHLFESDHADGA